MKQHKNLCSDLSKIVEHDPVKFRKVYDDMYALRETWVDKIQREATELAEQKVEQKFIQAEQKLIQAEQKSNQKLIQAERKAEQKAYEKEVSMVLKMINKNCDDEFIQNVTDFSLEEIAKIREEKA